MIVRLMGDGQYRVDDDLLDRLNEIDEAAAEAAEVGDAEALRQRLEELVQAVRAGGQRLPHDDLSPSDLIVPPADLSLDEARELFGEEGLIPDLPGR